VFARVAELQRAGAFSNLRGLLYFTDGMGIFPQKRPAWDTAFVLLEEPPMAVKMPPWAIRLVLELEGLEKAAREINEEYEIDLENLPQL
jgi:predicted metal-dependent peptidase